MNDLKPEVLPTLRFYTTMIRDYHNAKKYKLTSIWWFSFISGIVGDILFLLAGTMVLVVINEVLG